MMKVNKYITKRKCISMNRIPSALNCHLPRGTEYNFILLYVFFFIIKYMISVNIGVYLSRFFSMYVLTFNMYVLTFR